MADKASTSKAVCEYAAEINDVGLQIDAFNPPPEPELDEGGGLLGSRYRDSSWLTQTKHDLKFSIDTKMTYAEAESIIPLFFGGGTDSGAGNFTGFTKQQLFSDPAATANKFDLMVDYLHESGKLKKYNDNYLTRVEVTAQDANPLQFLLHFIGTAAPTEPTDSIASPTGASWASAADNTVYINANTYHPDSIKWIFDYHLLYGFPAQLYPLVRGAGEFEVSGEMTFTLNTDVWADLIAIAGTTSTIANLNTVADDGTSGVGFEATKIRITGPWPTISGEGPEEVTHTLGFKGYGSAASMCNAYTKTPA